MGQALRLASNFVILSDKFEADTVEVTQDLYERLDGVCRTPLDFELCVRRRTGSTWEVRLDGDEFVILVSGDADLILAKDDGDETVRMTEPGTFAIVPRDTWHTARIRSHTVMMFITPGEGTVNAEEPVRGTP